MVGGDDNPLHKIDVNLEVDGKRIKARPKQRCLDMIDGEFRTFRTIQNRPVTKQNDEIDRNEPTPLLNNIMNSQKV